MEDLTGFNRPLCEPSLSSMVEDCINYNFKRIYMKTTIFDDGFQNTKFLIVKYNVHNHTYELIAVLSYPSKTLWSKDISTLTSEDLQCLKDKLRNDQLMYSIIEEIWQTGYHQEMADLFDELAPNTVFK